MPRDLRQLPKAHLHLHLEGAMRPSTMHDLLSAAGLPAPPRADGTFATFLSIYDHASQGLRSPDDIARLVREVVEDAAADGAVWVEPAEWLKSTAAERAGLSDVEAVLRVVLEALNEAARQTGIGTGLMVSTNRLRPTSEAEALARLAARNAGQGVVSFGLAGDEASGPPEPFSDAFAIARAAGLLATPHGGELAGPVSVRGALDTLGARRIQHGVRSVEDPALLQRLADEQVCLDVCPTSNVHLRVVPSLSDHPLPALVHAGIPVSLNADDPLVFGAGLLAEYELARASFGFDDATLAHIAACSIRASGAPEELKRTALAGVDAWLDAAE
ncbi:MAG TPA: adenosine deaminase [Chloroflexota bacterium]|jgi:adenosine deaminase|nr:adenosine deaminase [Chloroflexota bacterium]